MKRLRRKIDNYLIEWKNSDNKLPLIIKGARQIGKTNAIRNFGNNNYKTFIEINFVVQPQFKTIFEDGRYDVICSGSLMGINYKEIESNSVGNKIDYILQIQDY